MSGPRVALLTPYWSFFEANVPLDLRADRDAITLEIETLLDGAADVCARAVIDSREAGEDAAVRALQAGVDAVVVVQTMAVPPAFTLAALGPLARTPLVVLAVHRRHALADGFTHADITTEGATVGVPQLINVLHRRGRPHALVNLMLGDAESRGRARDAVAVAAAAGRVRAARIGRVGRPIDGYDCVDVDVPSLERVVGCSVVEVDVQEVRSSYCAAAPSACAEVTEEVRRDFALAARVEEEECLERSVRFAVALESLDARLGLSAGVMNCHVAELRHADVPGITPCFALGRETTRGTPWTCSGDVVTVVAMLALKALGRPAVYHEIEALDHATDEAVLANTGEHDLGWARSDARPELRRNVWFDGVDPRCGACACFSPPPGPAALVAFTPHADEPSGFRFVVAEGEYTARRFSHTGTVNAAFRFAGSQPVARAWGEWAAAGPNHHSAATTGHVASALEGLAAHLGVGCVVISSADEVST